MQNQNYLAPTLMLLILLIAGCDKGSDQHPITDIDVYEGTDGITANFFNMPDSVFENSYFRVIIEMGNKGAYPSSKEEEKEFVGYLALGLEDDYMEVSNKDGWANEKSISRYGISEAKKAKFHLSGRSIENTLGDKGIANVNVHTKKIREDQSEQHDTDVLMSVCYKYQTKATPTVCIDTTQYGFKEKEKSCTVQDILLDSQGAPVAVTNIETQMLPKGADAVEPMFLISIENKGNGEVVSIGDETSGQLVNDYESVIEKACSAEPLTHKFFNSVFVSASLGKDQPLECEPNNGLVRLKNKEGLVRCSLGKEISPEGTYTTPLQITLDYGYMFTVSKKVTVKKILRY